MYINMITKYEAAKAATLLMFFLRRTAAITRPKLKSQYSALTIEAKAKSVPETTGFFGQKYIAAKTRGAANSSCIPMVLLKSVIGKKHIKIATAQAALELK